MKIVVYVHCLTFGGTERMATHLANHFSDSGHDVTILCNSDPGCISYPLRSSINYIVMNVGGKSNNAVMAVRNNIRRVAAIRRELRQIGPDFLIAMSSTASVSAAVACIGLDFIKVGREQNNPVAESAQKKKSIKMRKLAYRWLDTVVAQTEITGQWLFRNSSAKNVSVIPGAVILPLDRSEPILMPFAKKNGKILLAVGRLSAQKQFDHLIRAFNSASLRCHGWQLVILGDGESRESLEMLVDELDLRSTVHMPGFVGNVGDWYEASDLFALTSAYEGFPNVVIEALAHGLPVVSYDCDTGPKEMIENNVNGLLVTPNSIESMQDSLFLLMSDNEKRCAASLSAKNIIERLNINKVCEQWIAVYDDARRERNSV